jgi:hypothetical protein
MYLKLEWSYFTEWVIEVKPDINLIEVHPIIESFMVGIQWMVCWWVLVHSGPKCRIGAPASLVQTLKRQ